MAVHEVLGESVHTPVEIRSARACSALFSARERPARQLLAGTGLEPVRMFPGRTLCALAFVQYTDGDLGPYHEFAVSLLCRQPGQRRTIGAYIHWLPVNQSFTCEAGQSIWGFPKEILDIDLSLAPRKKRCLVRENGHPAVALQITPGVRTPTRSTPTPIDAYTFRDGVLRRTPWLMDPAAVRMRPGGARLVLGDHPVAEQLRSLGLPRTALSTSDIGTLRMTFGDAEEVR